MIAASNLITANIENLTALWKAASTPFNAYFENSIFNYGEVRDSDWPNRLWFNDEPSQEGINMVLENSGLNLAGLKFPYWDIYNSNSYELLEKNGFKLLSEQIGMSLRLGKPFTGAGNLNIMAVSNDAEAELWAEVYPKGFGYQISKEIVIKTYNDINYYLAYYQNQPAGTAMVLNTGGISGIHGIGVVPEMRRKGFAEEIMNFVLNRSIESNAEYATLQSSPMGKNIYLKLGFEEQFVIKNYGISI